MKRILCLVLSILSMFVLVSCKETTTKSEVVVIVDAVGRSVELDKNSIERVVCIGAGALRLYSYVGDMNKIVGAEDIDRNQDGTDYSLIGANGFRGVSRPYYDYNKEYLKTTLSIGLGGPKNQVNPDTEKIIVANPDLIISEIENVETVNKLQNDTGKPVVVVKYGNNHDIFSETLYSSLELLGNILKKEERATEVINYLKASKTELGNNASKATQAEKEKSFFIGCLGNWGTQDLLSTSKNFVLFNVSSINNAVKSDATLDNGKITLEALVNYNPDNIILDAAGIQVFKNSSYANNKEIISSLDAVKNGNVYLEMPFNAYYTNIEVALINAYYIASIAYPSVYQNFSIEAKATEVLAKFLGANANYSLISEQNLSYGGYQRIESLEDFLK
ncbi:MAG: ABC transporter substrate-binding protein [Gammaproteobacteria bacterium]|nr:ABC transporter substrate-binding protein [Gammaproteobacteria bacterium]